ncbi:hypothetical protein BN946_scf184586.g8 [Trametes cinnabarina]|uniref:Uncharacterized protein n=1 Tax=Pycnoporus cinnabarinus TaxID=5643 RepID=A0A060SQ67_PYCCI|nr:hypothetical protein BN946_scf184586.g8 [Trametes cinnabarina]
MYKIIRRISSSFFSRPDRPWSEDATSTAPQIGRKRRLSTEEHEERETTPSAKKHRAESDNTPDIKREQSPAQPGQEVKEVTEGVREVELEDGKSPGTDVTEDAPAEKTGTEEAAAVPLPESPELKPTEDVEQSVAGTVAEETGASNCSALEQSEDGLPEAPKASSQEIATSAADDGDVPGLTLPSGDAPVRTTSSTTTNHYTPAVEAASSNEETSASQ